MNAEECGLGSHDAPIEFPRATIVRFGSPHDEGCTYAANLVPARMGMDAESPAYSYNAGAPTVTTM